MRNAVPTTLLNGLPADLVVYLKKRRGDGVAYCVLRRDQDNWPAVTQGELRPRPTTAFIPWEK